MLVSYSWLQEYFNKPLPAAEELAELLSLHAFEVEEVRSVGDDTIIDVDVLPNRAHDCLSHRGIAKEIGAILGSDVHKDPLRKPYLALPESTTLRAEVDDQIPNTSTLDIVIRDVRVGESPEWLKERLAALGQRSINNIVDITNYVMLDMGQPSHAFDAKVFEGGLLRIKCAEEGERLTMLGGEVVELTKSDMVISDGTRALDVGGIRGGVEAEISEETKDIVLAVSHFDPVGVRKTAQRLKLWTDAAKRYQNDPSPHLVEHGAREALEMILDLAGGTVEGVVRAGEQLPEDRTVTVSHEHINVVLGLGLSEEDITDIFTRLSMGYEVRNESFVVAVPPERMDLGIPEDIIEEVGRLYGYDKLPEMPLPAAEPESPSPEFVLSERVRAVLLAHGFSEVYGYALKDGGKVKLQNALTSEKGYLREDMASGLSLSLKDNKAHAPLIGAEHIDLFEIGHVWTPEEEIHVAFGTTRKKKESIYAEVVKALEKDLGVSLKGEVKDDVYEIDVTPALAQKHAWEMPAYEKQDVAFVVPSVYPYALRDVAVWTPEGTSKRDVEEIISQEAEELLMRLDCFDAFSKEGRTSYAYHLVFQSPERTLSDDEVNEVMDRVYAKLGEREGFEIR